MNTLHVRMRWLAWHRPLLARWAQVALIVLFWFACDQLVRRLHLPVPGSVLALALLLVLLLAGVVPAVGLRRGADWLLAEMLLFFIPAVMAVWEHLPLLRQDGLRILLVILLGTVLVMGTTALLVDLMFRWRQRHAR
ncbi:CidA/LrgA family protein [Dyella sp. C9]|uniref:CidA/LrgA family protein n=1 Tax=Dyella sp. C9 TaxID=2202154 RepID=UPI0018E59AD3|nr:CidA/LrgA family protein [Dyella sp. C9]